MPNVSKHNRLNLEKSPYLLQHAYNPVNWYPWGEEAFARARQDDKPIFLSIGYSTCHWCHVMAHESFEDDETAALLNQDYICIKVDREERPDIDHVYMSVCQAMTGQGGWPLTIIMTPDQKPFFAATYIPKHSGRMVGLMELLPRITQMWREQRGTILNSSEEIHAWMQESEQKVADGTVNEQLLHQAFGYLSDNFDQQYGGFGNAPKFPTPHNIMFLLRYYHWTGKKRALTMAEKTLQSMYRGGIYDHIGFGFARYSTDKYWLVPHFEKMLYDNALLAIAYLEAYQVTGDTLYSRVAEEIFTYVLRDMASPGGGFYSAQDADSEGAEGKFYLWDRDEVIQILGEADGDQFCKMYDITAEGNFEGKNIPNRIKGDPAEPSPEDCIRKLFACREQRVHPHRDDKILTSWNGIMIAALAMGARVLQNGNYLQAAEKAADFILRSLTRDDGRLLSSWRDGKAGCPAFAGDYANLIWGLLELYQSGFQARYLKAALQLNHDLLKHFWDPNQGGVFLYGEDAEQLAARPRDWFDGALPSSNSVTALNLLRLSLLTGDQELTDRAQTQLETQAGVVAEIPAGSAFYLMAAAMYLAGPQQIVVVGDKENEDTGRMIETVHSAFIPFALTLFKDMEDKELSILVPHIDGMKMVEDKPTVYVCKNFTCQSPVNELSALQKTLGEM
ncbi:MAG TPA: thioredoxin domain-containing protein [Syntrophomonadaceae bacterium]|nr:thioredoxin domain-containing protein [Syntrophomonadaceae bacterium]